MESLPAQGQIVHAEGNGQLAGTTLDSEPVSLPEPAIEIRLWDNWLYEKDSLQFIIGVKIR